MHVELSEFSEQEGNGPIDQHATGLKGYRAGLKGGPILPASVATGSIAVVNLLQVTTSETLNENSTKVFRDATSGFPSAMVYRGSTSEV